ncbi:MAG: hypothetical protein ACYCOO_02410 [Chitinophagaceae bacterium]
MTFIASVIAKKGVALIADSLVTTQEPILHYKDFRKYITSKQNNGNENIQIDPEELSKLFNDEPVFTKDYEDKLFKLNKYTGIATTGIAYLNQKSIGDIVHEFISHNSNIEDFSITIEDKLDSFKSFLTNEIKQHLTKFDYIGICVFIVTFYEVTTYATHIYKVIINTCDKSSLTKSDYNYITLEKKEAYEMVVCDGQNRISDRILYGPGNTIFSLISQLIKDILKELHQPDTSLPENYIQTLLLGKFYKDIIIGEADILNLKELSLQQAVDLASLLMRIEVDFQKYTKNIPTVGGLIKLATIDQEKGFDFVLGNHIDKPKFFQT